MDIAKSKILHDRELALLGKDDVLDDNVGAFSVLSQNHLELTSLKLQVLVDDGILVLPLKVCQGDVQTVVFTTSK